MKKKTIEDKSGDMLTALLYVFLVLSAAVPVVAFIVSVGGL